MPVQGPGRGLRPRVTWFTQSYTHALYLNSIFFQSERSRWGLSCALQPECHRLCIRQMGGDFSPQVIKPARWLSQCLLSPASAVTVPNPSQDSLPFLLTSPVTVTSYRKGKFVGDESPGWKERNSGCGTAHAKP